MGQFFYLNLYVDDPTYVPTSEVLKKVVTCLIEHKVCKEEYKEKIYDKIDDLVRNKEKVRKYHKDQGFVDFEFLGDRKYEGVLANTWIRFDKFRTEIFDKPLELKGLQDGGSCTSFYIFSVCLGQHVYVTDELVRAGRKEFSELIQDLQEFIGKKIGVAINSSIEK
ncbi:MAG: hypothetical protein ACFFCS_29665 [Candidatus Hodarchaeota archaeon]